MALPHFVLLYVDEPEASAAFYARWPIASRSSPRRTSSCSSFRLTSGLGSGLAAASSPRRVVLPTPENWRWGSGPAKKSKRSARIESAKARSSCKNQLQWTSAERSLPQTSTDIDFGCSALRLRRSPSPRGTSLCGSPNLRPRSRTDRLGYAGPPRCL